MNKLAGFLERLGSNLCASHEEIAAKRCAAIGQAVCYNVVSQLPLEIK